MSGPPLVSVLIRSMDRPTLDRALASIAMQDYPRVEVVVVAACGPGHRPLPARCGAHALRLVVPDRPLMRCPAGNFALAQARGDWLNFLDDDDEFLPGHLRTMIQFASTRPECRLVHSQSQAVDPQGRQLFIYGSAFQPWRQLEAGFFQFGSVLIARSLIDEGVRFDENLDVLDDLEFFVQCAQRTTFAYYPAPTSRYYATAGSSGTGFGDNNDTARIDRCLEYVHAKWADLKKTLEASPQARLQRAQHALNVGRDDEAEHLLAGLRAQVPDDVNVLYLSGLIALRRGDARAAVPWLRRAAMQAPAHAGLREALQRAHAQAGVDQ
jgi:glycosyltransferase involved in cell wall biosynthesis